MDTEQMNKPPEPWEFRSKPVWQRLIIMIGGVTVNLILGILIYMMIVGVWGKDYIPSENITYGYDVPELYKAYGFQDGDVILTVEGEPLEDANSSNVNRLILVKNATEFKVKHSDESVENISLPDDIDFKAFKQDAMFSMRIPAQVDTILAGTPAEKAGIQKGDKIVAVNGKRVRFWDEMSEELTMLSDEVKTETMHILAAKYPDPDLTATPQEIKDIHSDLVQPTTIIVDRQGEEKTLTITTGMSGKLGIAPSNSVRDLFKVEHRDYGFLEAIPAGWSDGISTLGDYVGQLKFLGTEKGVSSMGGFGTFGSLFAATWDWQVFWERTALISIILAFMNILPIPALDGGHVMFLIYEMIAGKPPHQKVLEYAQIAGFVLILGLVIYANANDIIRAL